MTTIKQSIADQIKTNPAVVGRLMVAFTKSSDSIVRWINRRDIRLTTPIAIQIISEELKVNESEVLEGSTEKTAA